MKERERPGIRSVLEGINASNHCIENMSNNKTLGRKPLAGLMAITKEQIRIKLACKGKKKIFLTTNGSMYPPIRDPKNETSIITMVSLTYEVPEISFLKYFRI